MSESTEVATIDNSNSIDGAIAQLKNGTTPMYSSIKGDNEESRLTVLDAVMGSLPIAEHLGKTISLANVIVQPVEMADEATGELNTQPRVILIDTDGTAYHAITKVLFRDIQNVIAIVGEPHEWSNPMQVQVVKEGNGARKFFTLKRVTAKK